MGGGSRRNRDIYLTPFLTTSTARTCFYEPMADVTAPSARRRGNSNASLAARRKQPAPIRTHSEGDTLKHDIASSHQTISHVRHKSQSLASGVSRAAVRPSRRSSDLRGETQPRSPAYKGPDSIPEMPHLEISGANGLVSPPITPVKCGDRAISPEPESQKRPEIIQYDFSVIDYHLERAHFLGKGLWSVVLLADGKVTSPKPLCGDPPSPPATPEAKRLVAPSSVFAVKTPINKSAREVFRQEATVLSDLMHRPGANQYVVSFFGLDERNSALVFEAVIGGSLENLNSRLRQMTEVARHLELVNLFFGLADDLISGLDFLHAAGVVHADIKPANVLLDISEHYSLPKPVLRARYIDFSASFRLESDDSTTNSGGTWDYMAPEQMRTQKDINTPTFASDVWSLGITLLSLIVGGSPYTAACAGNKFMLMEAIKSGDPLGFGRMEPRAQKRMAACQNFIDCSKLALKKDREKRVSAAAWKNWLVSQEVVA